MSGLSPRAQALKDKYIQSQHGARWSYRPRDSQRQRLYSWEWRERRTPDGFFYGDPLMTVDETQRFVARVWRRLGLSSPPAVRAVGAKRRWARGGRYGLTLPPWALCKHVTLHELTHSLLPAYCPSHGPEFVRVFVDLLYRFMHVKSGPLRRSLRERKIRVGRSDVTWELVRDSHGMEA